MHGPTELDSVAHREALSCSGRYLRNGPGPLGLGDPTTTGPWAQACCTGDGYATATPSGTATGRAALMILARAGFRINAVKIGGSVALITGADRGLGWVFALELESVARQAFDAVEAGEIEVLADERTRLVKASLPRDHELLYAPLQQIFYPPATGSG
jgi:hypothetical protein